MHYSDFIQGDVMRMPDGVEVNIADCNPREVFDRWASGEGRQSDPDKPAIFCMLNGGSPEWWNVTAFAEDGEGLAGHLCSSPIYFQHDLGLTSAWKHESYMAKYPDGYRLVWIERDDVVNRTADPACLAALDAGNARHAERKAAEEAERAATEFTHS